MPRSIPGGTWRKIIKANCENGGAPDIADPEYKVYQQLCWMKHSLPTMQDMRAEPKNQFSLIFGPHTDERAINHAWFALEHAGRLTELVVGLLISDFGTDETRAALQALGEKRTMLHQRAIDRFGQDNPFLEAGVELANE
jgi:hypothetical protein